MTETLKKSDDLMQGRSEHEILQDMARDMEVALYRRYTRTEAAKILGMPEKDLEQLRVAGRIAYLSINNSLVGFFGCQLLTYLLDCVVPVDAQAQSVPTVVPEAPAPTIHPEAELVSVDDAIMLFGIGKTKFYAMMKADEVEYVKIGRRTLIKRASLRQLIGSSSA